MGQYCAVRIAVNGRLLAAQPLEGMGLYTVEVLRGLLAALPQAAFLLVTDRRGPVPPLPRAVERVVAGPPARHPVLFWWWFEVSVPRVLRRWRADAFVSLENFCSLRAPAPTLLVVHDLAYRHLPGGVGPVELAYYRRYMPRFVRRAEALVAVSDYTRRDLAAAYGVDPARVRVAYNGVRARFGRLAPKRVAEVRDRLTAGRPYVLFLGAVHPRKNVDGLVRAFDRFGASEAGAGYDLVIAGRLSWDTSPTAAAIAASPLRDRIHVLGRVPDDELAGVVGAAFALALPSHFEGFGVPLVEAMACGVPVVASDVSALPEVVGDAGLLVDPAGDASLADALTRLASDDALYGVLAEAGPPRAARFTWAATTEVIAEEVVRIAGSNA